ncbi:cytochrome P450 [Myxococcota bacterium]|nr:cytochrome P450 [Myxococcota bacterium]
MKPLKSLSVDEIDLSDPLFWVRPIEEREGAFATLREQRPLPFFEEQPIPAMPELQGPGYWSLTRHAHILEASRNPEIYSSALGATSIINLPPAFNEFFGSMINMDDPRHGRLRRIVSRGFTPKSLQQLEHQVQSRASAVIDRVIEKGECDFVTEIAAPLPLEIVCDLMGIPESQSQVVFEQTNVILGLTDPEYVPPGSDIQAAALHAGSELNSLMKEIAAERRRKPQDDLTTALLNAELEEGALSDQELASFFILLVSAGNETTRNAISHGMKALCDHPDERRRWQADFDKIAPTAIEEIIRWASPVIFMRRTLTRDVTLGGQALSSGDKVILWYNSGNRDEAAFEAPYRFDVTRTPNEHVGFGGPGPHYCLGANLARREIRVIFREILTRLPDLEITGPPGMLASNFIHGIKRMPCAFSPSSPAT